MLMQGAMVRATLRGDKRQTRRLRGLEGLNRYPGQLAGESALGPLGYRGLCPGDHYVANKAAYHKHPAAFHWCLGEGAGGELQPIPLRCPYGGVGDRLWIKETQRSSPAPGQQSQSRLAS